MICSYVFIYIFTYSIITINNKTDIVCWYFKIIILNNNIDYIYNLTAPNFKNKLISSPEIIV